MWIVLSLLAGAFVVLVVANLSSSAKKIEHRIEHLYRAGDAEFVRSMGGAARPGIVPAIGCARCATVTRSSPRMLEAIRGARRTICFETFIYWSGSIGRKFAEALSERARAGVKVHVVLDWVGSARSTPRCSRP